MISRLESLTFSVKAPSSPQAVGEAEAEIEVVLETGVTEDDNLELDDIWKLDVSAALLLDALELTGL